MVTVETASPDHAADICRICTAGWRDAYTDVLSTEYIEANVRTIYDLERIGRQIRESDGAGSWLVALDGGESVVGAICDCRPEPGIGGVFGFYVHPERQGEGAGSRLLTSLTERQRERGAAEQHVHVFADHDDAFGFYESKGFEADERFAAATVDGVDPDCEAVRFARSI